jgi:phosphoenolpyruvate carboxykinase (ATP)
MPPIARLTPAQAMYHFLSGFTSKAAGTERGVKEPEPTFSTCFGAPFLPRPPEIYGKLLRDKIAEGDTTCWLVNTGWTGGGYGEGSRMPIGVTRALLSAAINSNLDQAEFVKDPNFGFDVPKSVQNVDPSYLNPRSTWKDVSAYDEAAKKLVNLFVENFEQHIPNVDNDVKRALSL